jgi:hypothetical protein
VDSRGADQQCALSGHLTRCHFLAKACATPCECRDDFTIFDAGFRDARILAFPRRKRRLAIEAEEKLKRGGHAGKVVVRVAKSRCFELVRP